MSEERKYYCRCEDNCLFETMSKEQILTAIEQAIRTGSIGDCDTGFITKLKDANSGRYVTVWVGTQAQYNALNGNIVKDCLYIITDDTTGDDIDKAITDMSQRLDRLENGTAIDISGVILLSVSSTQPSGLTSANISVKSSYVPRLGIVFYNYDVKFSGEWLAGEELSLWHDGGYKPTINLAGIKIAGVCNSGFYAEYLRASADYYLCKLTAEKDFTDGGRICVNGWYFCDGEG